MKNLIVHRKKVLSDVKKRSPVIVGLSPTSYSMTWTIEFCRLLKATTKCYIILGGNMVTHLGRELLEKSR